MVLIKSISGVRGTIDKNDVSGSLFCVLLKTLILKCSFSTGFCVIDINAKKYTRLHFLFTLKAYKGRMYAALSYYRSTKLSV